jgi:hypothetical protein
VEEELMKARHSTRQPTLMMMARLGVAVAAGYLLHTAVAYLVDRRHRKPLGAHRDVREAGMDRTLEESFPASDPPSSIPDPADHERVAADRATFTTR